jgi:ABC-2 type transport system ATP-binding protein
VATAIACAAVSKRYANGVLGLDAVTLEVPTGGALALVGQNGAGKSTLMKLVLGLLLPTSGRVVVLGHARVERAHGRLGYLPEGPAPEPGLAGRDWLRHLGRVAGLRDVHARVERALEEVDLVAAAGRRMSGYSRGMMQRVALAQALLGEPELLILDEPTAGLDPESRWRIREVVRARRAAGATVVMSSHDLAEVETLCDTVAVIHRGRLLAAAPLAELRDAGPRVEIEIGGGATPEQAAALGLDRLGVEVRDGRLLVPSANGPEVLTLLLAAGVPIVSLNPVRRSLEQAFLEVTRA